MTSKFDFLVDLNHRLIECKKWGFNPTTVYYPQNVVPSGVSYVMSVNVQSVNIFDKSGNVIDFAFSEVRKNDK